MARTRRSLLRAGGVAAVVGVAGCGSADRDAGVSETDREEETPTSDAAATTTGVSDAATGADLDREPLPAGALWLAPLRDPPGFAPGRYFRQVSVGSVAAAESSLHPAVFDELSGELWDRPERLFGVSSDAIDVKYQVPGENVRVFEGSFDPDAVGEYLGRPYDEVGERGGLRLFARQLRRGERLVAVDDRHLLAGSRTDATKALRARFGAADPLPLTDDHVWTAATAVSDADLLSVTDRYNKGRRGLLSDVAARGIAWSFEGDQVRLRAPFVFFGPESADPDVVRTWAAEFRGLDTYENLSISRREDVVTVDATTPIELFDRGVSGRPGE
jgi:hypothetical protein